MVHYAMEYYIVETRKELLPFAIAWMELENIMLSEVSQLVKARNDLTYKKNLINKIN